MRPAYETNEGGRKIPGKGKFEGDFGGFGGNAAAWTEKVPKEVKKHGNRRCSQVGKRKAAWECPRRRGQGGDRKAPVAPAGAVPPATIKIKKHGCALRRFQRAIADFVCFHCPLVASAEAKSPACGKERLCLQDQLRGRAHLARQCEVAGRAAWGRICGCAKLLAGDASLPAPLLGASLELSARKTVGALPQPQGSSAP